MPLKHRGFSDFQITTGVDPPSIDHWHYDLMGHEVPGGSPGISASVAVSRGGGGPPLLCPLFLYCVSVRALSFFCNCSTMWRRSC